MQDVPPLDTLPPEARFTVRGLAAGLTAAEVADVLRVGVDDRTADGGSGDAGGPGIRARVPGPGEEGPPSAFSEAGARLLRRVVRVTGGPPLTAASGDDALRAALAPALALASAPPARRPGKPCPTPAILRELALGRLDGPLMLAEAEHAADCAACMAALVAARRAGAAEPGGGASGGASARPPLVRFDLPLVLGALAGLAIVFVYLFWR